MNSFGRIKQPGTECSDCFQVGNKGPFYCEMNCGPRIIQESDIGKAAGALPNHFKEQALRNRAKLPRPSKKQSSTTPRRRAENREEGTYEQHR